MQYFDQTLCTRIYRVSCKKMMFWNLFLTFNKFSTTAYSTIGSPQAINYIDRAQINHVWKCLRLLFLQTVLFFELSISVQRIWTMYQRWGEMAMYDIQRKFTDGKFKLKKNCYLKWNVYPNVSLEILHICCCRIWWKSLSIAYQTRNLSSTRCFIELEIR